MCELLIYLIYFSIELQIFVPKMVNGDLWFSPDCWISCNNTDHEQTDWTIQLC